MKFVLKTYDDIRRNVETMTVRQLLRAVACPAAGADDRSMEKDFAGVYIHPATKKQVNDFVEYINGGDEPMTLVCSAVIVICGICAATDLKKLFGKKDKG